MCRVIKYVVLATVFIVVFASLNGLAQSKAKKAANTKRDVVRHAMKKRDSVMRSLNKADTSINSLLQRLQRYSTIFNSIKNGLADGLDTVQVSTDLPAVIKRLDKITAVANTHKASTFRYLFVLRDNLDHITDQLDGWQADLADVNTKLVQQQKDLLKFSQDSLLKITPSDSLVKQTFFKQRKEVFQLWHRLDSINRGSLLKVNLLQDKISISYTSTLDESDQIDSKVKEFASKAIAGETNYIWYTDPQVNDLKTSLKNTIKLDKLLFLYFIKSETVTHLAAILFVIVMLIWIIFNRNKSLKNIENSIEIIQQAPYIRKKPVLSALLIGTAIIPYFYDHPPTVFLVLLFLISLTFSLILLKGRIVKSAYDFLLKLGVLAVFYAVSNLLIEISNLDRYFIFSLSIIAIILAVSFFKEIKKSPEQHQPYVTIALRIFIGLQGLSLLLNTSGRFSLAKIAGVTAVFNLWLAVIFYTIGNIIIEALFLHFQSKKGGDSIVNWLDYALIEKKFKGALFLVTSLLWVFTLLQNLDVDDWARDTITDILSQSQAVGGAQFTFGGFVIFILVIWLSSLTSKIISYLYDVSAQRVTDLSVQKRKNRTSALIIRIGVFSAGFLLAVAASGFPLDKLTIIISAFGVGIGFGLQNIVNNLVSGLILAFEKPINIGDVIEVDGHTGTMKEIGIRSSRVMTADGSEIIIPNGDLISHQVVNWTLSNNNRQIDLRITVAYGSDINKIKGLIKNLLANREDIMTSPLPAVFLNSLNENTVEFKVLFWEADISTTSELKSKVLFEIYDALKKEGVSLPSTQKDINLYFPNGIPLEAAAKVIAPKTESIKEK